MDPESPCQPILEEFRTALQEGRGLERALDRILVATSSRATGLWRLQGSVLKLLAFRSAADMPVEVHEGFAAATAEVPLESTGLGIVKAALEGKPAPALRQDPGGAMGGSAAWLERFQAEQSLAVPVQASGHVLGVLAISAPYRFGEGTSTWQLLVDLAGSLAPLME